MNAVLKRSVCFAAALAILGATGPALGQDATKVKISRLSFPSLSSIMVDIVKARGIDKKHGIDLEAVTTSQISGYYGALASGEANMTASGPLVVQKMILEGVNIRIGLTWARMNILSVVTNDPSIKTVADLKGQSIAATMGSSEYQTLAVYGRTQNIVFGKDVTVVNATPPLARSQLLAKRVKASLLWEPTTTMVLKENPDVRVILEGDKAWSAIANTAGWDLVLAVREDFLEANPKIVPRLAAMFQEAQRWYKENPDEADKILQESIKLPPGIFKAALESGRLAYDIKPASEEHEAIWNMFKVAVDEGYLPKLPSQDVIYKP